MNSALTGIRPTGELTVANYVGAMEPMVALQDTYEGPVNVFVADLHALTDQEPDVIARAWPDAVRSYLAAGIDPNRTTVYLQSQIGPQTLELTSLLERHVTVAELLRVPTLKEKLRAGQDASAATAALLRYPVLMAADIVIQDATDVPVGADQLPHIELTRRLVDRFNSLYGQGEQILATPSLLAIEGVRIVALNGDAKMSKSRPAGALFLADSPAEAAQKIRRAVTAPAGEMAPALESHFLLAERLSTEPAERFRLAELRRQHMEGLAVMAEFKGLLTEIVAGFLGGFQERFGSISDAEVKRVLREGGERASEQADRVMGRVHQALGLVSTKFLYG